MKEIFNPLTRILHRQGAPRADARKRLEEKLAAPHYISLDEAQRLYEGEYREFTVFEGKVVRKDNQPK